jgi:plasmid stabilization system protein ParE
MKVVYTDEALDNLDGILAYIASNYPTISAPFERRLGTVIARIGAWPESAEEVAERPSVRIVPSFDSRTKSFIGSRPKPWRYSTHLRRPRPQRPVHSISRCKTRHPLSCGGRARRPIARGAVGTRSGPRRARKLRCVLIHAGQCPLCTITDIELTMARRSTCAKFDQSALNQNGMSCSVTGRRSNPSGVQIVKNWPFQKKITHNSNERGERKCYSDEEKSLSVPTLMDC